MLHCNRTPDATAIITGSEKYPAIRGKVSFFQENSSVRVHAEISGLPKNESGFFGFHIHEGANCSGVDFPNTGGHLNPEMLPHPSHMGDLPPLLSCNGKALMTARTCRFRVRDIIGKTVIIHYGTDNFRTQPSGDAGEKIACGVIRAE